MADPAQPKDAKLKDLHESVTDLLLAAMVPGEEGINPKLVELAIKFLQQNGINMDMAETPKGQALVHRLPFLPVEDVA